MPQAVHALITPAARAETHPHLLTTYADNGEVDLLRAGDRFVLSACEEIPCGCDRVHSRKLTLQLTRRDAADLERALDCLLRATPQTARWSESALAAMAAGLRRMNRAQKQPPQKSKPAQLDCSISGRGACRSIRACRSACG